MYFSLNESRTFYSFSFLMLGTSYMEMAYVHIHALVVIKCGSDKNDLRASNNAIYVSISN